MPRIARGLVDEFIYHMLNRGNSKQEVFHKPTDYQAFIELMIEAKRRYLVKIFAYCLMPNHFHIVACPKEGVHLSLWMQWLMTSHVRRYHRHYQSSGHIWQGRFKSFIIQEDVHLLTILRYVEGNPVRAGLVTSATDWPWSSHKEALGEGSYRLIDICPVERPSEWSNFVNEPQINQEIEQLRQSVNRQTPFGTSKWQMRISKKLGLESTLRPRGRPLKRGREPKK